MYRLTKSSICAITKCTCESHVFMRAIVIQSFLAVCFYPHAMRQPLLVKGRQIVRFAVDQFRLPISTLSVTRNGTI